VTGRQRAGDPGDRRGRRRARRVARCGTGLRSNEEVRPWADGSAATALAIDPTTYEARAIAKPPQTTPCRALRLAHAVALLEDRLIAAHLDGVVVYALQR